MKELKGSAAVVTNAASGIDLSICRKQKSDVRKRLAHGETRNPG
jgi:hypothetical protein